MLASITPIREITTATGGRDKVRAVSLRNIRIVLHKPRGAANVGSAARAISNMGLGQLVVVRSQPLREAWIRAMAAHAGDVVDRMRRCSTLLQAVGDCALVVGTTCREGPYRRGTRAPRAAAAEIVARARTQPVALVFGPEDHGLSNADLKLCHQLITIPTSPDYPSLNLAQAVMICAYELWLAGESLGRTAEPEPALLASTAQVEQVLGHLRQALLAIGFLHRENPEHIMFAIRRLLGRTGLEEREVRILLGLARQIEWFGQGGWKLTQQATRAAEGR
jgi:tRNA/rRNA methyltransferase